MKIMCSYIFSHLVFFLVMIITINGLSSPIPPFTNYTYAVELLPNTVDLCWNINNETKEITFELHMNTTGWIALGISPAGGMTGADIGVGWVTQSGQLIFQDRYAYGFQTPVIDNTTINWFGIHGREQDGWTAIQFKRLINTCDSMDVPIKSGSNILIFAWGLVDPDLSVPNANIEYHGPRRGEVTIPLLSYSEPPSVNKFAGLDTVEFRVTNYTIPTNQSTFYCEIFKIPATITAKRHAIAREILINSSSQRLVYHLTLSECDAEAIFDDKHLPRGICDNNPTAYASCAMNIVIGWATGGDNLIEFPDEAGLPIGLNFSTKYYLIQVNYYNEKSNPGYTDSSGVRLYVGNKMRPNDLGGLTFGVDSSPMSLAIPPQVNAFSVDSYCGANASRYNFPKSGLTFFSVLDHTHLHGRSVWTKIIRNQTAVQYLFNAESFDPHYQFQHKLSQPIKVYPGDEFASRCVYQTMDKINITLGGRLPSQEMCIQVFNYYPRMSNLYTCASTIAPASWQTLMNATVPPDDMALSKWLTTINWTSDLASQWQMFYNTAARLTAFGRAGYYNKSSLASLPMYQDMKSNECNSQQNNTTVTVTMTTNLTTATTTTVTTKTTTNLTTATTTTVTAKTTTNLTIATTTTVTATTTTTLTTATTTTVTGKTTTTVTAKTTTTLTTATTTTVTTKTTTTLTTATTTTVTTTTSGYQTSASSTSTTSVTSTVTTTTKISATTIMTSTTTTTVATTTTSVKNISNNLTVQKMIFILPLLILCLINGIII